MTKPTDELTSLTRPELARLLASRTGHGDFEKYHERFEHEDYNPKCSCRKTETPAHILYYRKANRHTS